MFGAASSLNVGLAALTVSSRAGGDRLLTLQTCR